MVIGQFRTSYGRSETNVLTKVRVLINWAVFFIISANLSTTGSVFESAYLFVLSKKEHSGQSFSRSEKMLVIRPPSYNRATDVELSNVTGEEKRMWEMCTHVLNNTGKKSLK